MQKRPESVAGAHNSQRDTAAATRGAAGGVATRAFAHLPALNPPKSLDCPSRTHTTGVDKHTHARTQTRMRTRMCAAPTHAHQI